MEISKVIKKIYEFDFSKTSLADGKEILNSSPNKEFEKTFRRNDFENGIVVSVGGYKKGLVFKKTNGGEVYNNPKWYPEIVSFSLSFYGLKTNTFYRISIIGREAPSSVLEISKNRTLKVSDNNNNSLFDLNLVDVKENKTFQSVFFSSSNELTLFFNIGKVYLNNIIIEEVESDKGKVKEKPQEVQILSGKKQLITYGIFSTEIESESKTSLRLKRYSGNGLLLFYDRNEKHFILERDNQSEIIKEPFVMTNYIVRIGLEKFPGFISITDSMSNEFSPNTLKQGFLSFKLLNTEMKINENAYLESNNKILIEIEKIF